MTHPEKKWHIRNTFLEISTKYLISSQFYKPIFCNQLKFHWILMNYASFCFILFYVNLLFKTLAYKSKNNNKQLDPKPVLYQELLECLNLRRLNSDLFMQFLHAMQCAKIKLVPPNTKYFFSFFKLEVNGLDPVTSKMTENCFFFRGFWLFKEHLQISPLI